MAPANQVDAFDFIVVGGGLCGLVVAMRLSEDPNVTVCVLEAGSCLAARVQTQTPARFAENLAQQQTDWSFESTLQPGANGRKLPLPRGRGLGGSSCLNFLQFGRAHASEYDAFEKLGNKGWNWNELVKYFKKSETLGSTPEEQAKYGHSFDPSFHGTDGPVSKTLPREVTEIHHGFLKSAMAVGVPFNEDSSNGNQVGAWTGMQTVHPETGTRVSSASSYYFPNKSRKNLKIIENAHVTKVILKKAGLVEAEGVEYSQDGIPKVVSAKREVIISSGAFQTPQILELSGIGRRSVLEEHQIPVFVDLPGVGDNLQDHIFFLVIMELDDKQDSFDDLKIPERMKEELEIYAKTKKGRLAESTVSGFVFAPVNMFTNKEKIMKTTREFDLDSMGELSAGVRKGLEIQKEWNGRDDIPALEVILGQQMMGPVLEEGKKYCTIFSALMHPFARGSVHIASSDPLAKSAIDNRFLQNPIDMQICVESLKFIRRLAAAEPMKSMTTKEVMPGPAVQSDEAMEKYIRDTFSTTYHPMGTAAMLPRQDGGVVDPELRVYGTKNLRVVDMSIFPIQIAAHPQSSLYAVAEKAADIIKSNW